MKKVEIIEANACPDHIHMLVKIPPNISVAQFMGYLKGKSSLMIFYRYANLKYKYGNRHFWCRGYYVDYLLLLLRCFFFSKYLLNKVVNKNTSAIKTAQAKTNNTQCQTVVNFSKGIIENPKIIVATPIPRPITIEGINHFNDILSVPAIITSASSGNIGNNIIMGK